jgi:hypothetical protein
VAVSSVLRSGVRSFCRIRCYTQSGSLCCVAVTCLELLVYGDASLHTNSTAVERMQILHTTFKGAFQFVDVSLKLYNSQGLTTRTRHHPPRTQAIRKEVESHERDA